jgi:non-ribosomal peptide synthetase component F
MDRGSFRRYRHGPMHSETASLAPRARLETLHAIFEAQAEERPDAVAAVFGEEEARYAQL